MRIDDQHPGTPLPTLSCFGCGPANEKGLRLRSYVDGDSIRAEFAPWPEHDNGVGDLSGGIIATVLDCHSAAAVTLEAERRGYCRLGDALLPYVTADIDIRHLRPAPLNETVEAFAEIDAASEAEITAKVRLLWDGKPRAMATARWKRWRPRG